MPESTIQPVDIFIDKIESGRARLLCRWNITTSTRDEQTIYAYNEAALWWSFPYLDTDGVTVLDNYTAIEAFINANKTDILNYAKGTQITLVGKDKAKPSAAGKDKNKGKEEKEFTIRGNK